MFFHFSPSSVLLLSTPSLFLSWKVPYGEVGNVNQLNTCFCCSTLSGDFLPSVSGDGVPGISPGFGCDGEKVSIIVKELRRRVRLRGDIAVKKHADIQSRNIRILSEQVSNLETKLDCIMSYFDIQQQQHNQQHNQYQQHNQNHLGHNSMPSSSTSTTSTTTSQQQHQPLPQPILPPQPSSSPVPSSSTIERS